MARLICPEAPKAREHNARRRAPAVVHLAAEHSASEGSDVAAETVLEREQAEARLCVLPSFSQRDCVKDAEGARA